MKVRVLVVNAREPLALIITEVLRLNFEEVGISAEIDTAVVIQSSPEESLTPAEADMRRKLKFLKVPYRPSVELRKINLMHYSFIVTPNDSCAHEARQLLAPYERTAGRRVHLLMSHDGEIPTPWCGDLADYHRAKELVEETVPYFIEKVVAAQKAEASV